MMLTRVVARPVELDVVRFDGSLACRQFLEGWVVDPVSGQRVLVSGERVYVPSADGTVIGLVGDWVVRKVDGSFGVVRAADFDVLFEIEPDVDPIVLGGL